MENLQERAENSTIFADYSDYYFNMTDLTTRNFDQNESFIKQPLNIVLLILSILGLFANSFSIAATMHIIYGQTTHSKLIINLAVSDICIILSVILHLLETIEPPLYTNKYCVGITNQGFLHFALLATLLNLLAMAVDHYIAIMKPLHYYKILSRFRANLMLLIIWIISIIGGLLDIIVGSFTEPINDLSFCLHVSLDKFNMQIIILSFVLAELLMLICLYLRIFLEVKKTLARNQASHQNTMHSKKAIITTLLIVGTFMICWVPNSLYEITLFILSYTNPESLKMSISDYILVNTLLWILMLSNALCDPIIYALRLRDVQQGYKAMCEKLCNKELSRNIHIYPRPRRETRTIVSDTENKELCEYDAMNRADGIIIKENGNLLSIKNMLGDKSDGAFTTAEETMMNLQTNIDENDSL